MYPFNAIVKQEDMKRALILNLINPALGGVLIRGEKGTAKSTAVRALSDIMPDIKVINLPISATEDRVVGTLDIEHALKTGEKKFEPGILHYADKNILYVDEVNLLDDHVVDVLLDAAAMGVNRIEREGISYEHPSRFILVGTMNPEEGDLRPQLIDRFSLVVDVFSEDDIESRVKVLKNRIEFEKDPTSFKKKFEQENKLLLEKIEDAKKHLKEVEYSDEILTIIAKIAVELELDGHRADISMLKTAITNAAFEGRRNVIKDDLKIAARLSIPHRMRKRPFEDGYIDISEVYEMIDMH